MPKRTDISSILIIGAGPIVIGQAAEFDYSGSQAVKALKEEGYRVIVVNSNPATIMTDPETADATYVEPVTPEYVAAIIAKERPDAVLPTMGGQTGLNTALALFKDGTLAKYGVQLIGADADAIEMAEDRLKFRQAMDRIGLESPRSAIAHSLDDAMAAVEEIGLPAIIRPSFTLGGTGGGIAYNREEFETIVRGGLEASPTNEVLIEESVLGWKEYEMEVVRDKADNAIIICSIENVDPMGIHTGDSITVAPALTLTDKEYQIMRNASIAVLREIGVETGGSNVQFAVNPKDGRLVVIEMNPRVSRSSALASKATGFPIAKVAAKLAVGYTLDEIQNDITGVTPASFEPTIDYIVTKIPRFAFEKFKDSQAILSTAMKSVGEVMAIGRSFHESLQKALRGLETGLNGLDGVRSLYGAPKEDIEAALAVPSPDRLLVAAQALREGLSVAEVHAVTKYDPWFLERLRETGRGRGVGLPGRPAGRRRGDAPAEGDGLLRPATGRAQPQVGEPSRRRGENADPEPRPDSRRGEGDDRRDHRDGGAPPAPPARRPSRLQADRHLRRRVRGEDALYVFDLRGAELRRARGREPAFGPQEGRHPRRRAEPDRAGDRVRLLLRPCRLRAERGRLRDGHDQLQSGDGLDRLRHVGPPLFRAVDGRGRAGDPACRGVRGHAPRRDRPVRRADAAEAGPGIVGRGDTRYLAPRPTRSTWPRIASASRSWSTGWGCGSRSTASPAAATRRCRSPSGSAIRC